MHTAVRWASWFLACGLAVLSFVVAAPVLASAPLQETPEPAAPVRTPQVQEVKGFLQVGEMKVFRLTDVQQGQTIYARLENDSGNLDPFLALFAGDVDVEAVRAEFQRGILEAIEAGVEPHQAVKDVSDKVTLTWSDDAPPSRTAILSFVAPASGEYLLSVRSALVEESFGRFRLLLGLDAPDVLTGDAKATGATIATIDRSITPRQVGLETITGTLTAEDPTTLIYLQPLEAGDILYARIDALDSDLHPVMTLRDYGGKAIALANEDGTATSGTLTYTIPADAEGYFLDFVACCGADAAGYGSAQLTAGRNEPAALEGPPLTSTGVAVLRRPTPVKAGIRLQQITGVDQKAENFGAQIAIRMEWVDPDLAFDPDTCHCAFKVYNGDSFRDYVNSIERRWPDFTLYNQQNNRWTQNKVVTVYPDGRAVYLERATTTFQAPDFNFRIFPFDRQDFYIHLDMIYPYEYFILENDPAYASIGEQLGEEEWYITAWDTQLSRERISTLSTVSRYSLHFQSQRHLSYYVLRFFIPLALIMLVSWITLFLSSYTRRIEATTGNLLLFIAWNFSIGNDLPRLGYLTFMDVLLLTTFVLNVAIIVYNVILRRMESNGNLARAVRIDRVMLWLYPLSFFLLLITMYVLRQLFAD